MEGTGVNWRKATYSNGGESACVEVANMDWRKATYSNGGADACVEVASASGVLVRDTTNRAGTTLEFTVAAWDAFTADLRNLA